MDFPNRSIVPILLRMKVVSGFKSVLFRWPKGNRELTVESRESKSPKLVDAPGTKTSLVLHFLPIYYLIAIFSRRGVCRLRVNRTTPGRFRDFYLSLYLRKSSLFLRITGIEVKPRK